MESIKKNIALLNFDKQLYTASPIFISCDKYWDGGISAKDSLKNKAEFYSLSFLFSGIVKTVIQTLDEKPMLGKCLCDHENMYSDFSEMEEYEIFREITNVIKNKKYYQLSLPEDNDIIDLIIESNFRYFTHIALFLPNSSIIIEPSCHTEIIIYSQNKDKLLDVLNFSIKKHPSQRFEIKVIDTSIKIL